MSIESPSPGPESGPEAPNSRQQDKIIAAIMRKNRTVLNEPEVTLADGERDQFLRELVEGQIDLADLEQLAQTVISPASEFKRGAVTAEELYEYAALDAQMKGIVAHLSDRGFFERDNLTPADLATFLERFPLPTSLETEPMLQTFLSDIESTNGPAKRQQYEQALRGLMHKLYLKRYEYLLQARLLMEEAESQAPVVAGVEHRGGQDEPGMHGGLHPTEHGGERTSSNFVVPPEVFTALVGNTELSPDDRESVRKLAEAWAQVELDRRAGEAHEATRSSYETLDDEAGRVAQIASAGEQAAQQTFSFLSQADQEYEPVSKKQALNNIDYGPRGNLGQVLALSHIAESDTVRGALSKLEQQQDEITDALKLAGGLTERQVARLVDELQPRLRSGETVEDLILEYKGRLRGEDPASKWRRVEERMGEDRKIFADCFNAGEAQTAAASAVTLEGALNSINIGGQFIDTGSIPYASAVATQLAATLQQIVVRARAARSRRS